MAVSDICVRIMYLCWGIYSHRYPWTWYIDTLDIFMYRIQPCKCIVCRTFSKKKCFLLKTMYNFKNCLPSSENSWSGSTLFLSRQKIHNKNEITWLPSDWKSEVHIAKWLVKTWELCLVWRFVKVWDHGNIVKDCMTKALSSPDDIHTRDAALKNGSEHSLD